MASIYSLLFGPVLSSSTSYGSKWQSDLNSGIFTFLPDPGNRSYRVVFDYSFPDNWYMGEESGITYFLPEKPAFISFFGWQIVFQIGWSTGKRIKGLFWGCRFSEVWFGNNSLRM
jgi:hypothetical protein